MSTANLVDKAKEIATKAHDGQVRRGGAPYITHCKAVADDMASETVQAISWLHDVLEDTPVTVADLQMEGIPQNVIDAVVILTRLDDETYEQFIDRIVKSNNLDVLCVKYADIGNNLPTCRESKRAAYLDAKKKILARMMSLGCHASPKSAGKEEATTSAAKDTEHGEESTERAGEGHQFPFERQDAYRTDGLEPLRRRESPFDHLPRPEQGFVSDPSRQDAERHGIPSGHDLTDANG